MTHEAVPDITPDELERLRQWMTTLRRGLRTAEDLRGVWSAIHMLEEMIEAGRVLPEALEEFQGKIETMRASLNKTIRTIEDATGYVFDYARGWFIDPITGEFVVLRLEDYLY